MRYLLLALLLMACGSDPRGLDGVPIMAFHEVSSGFYRGAQPGSDGMRYLKSIGIKTIISVNNDPPKLERERQMADGMQIVSVPFSGFFAPIREDIEKVQNILANPSYRPIYLHCEHGRDRTGLLIALYRNWHEGWPKEKAYEEMLARGFRTILFPLERSFWEHAR